LIGFANIEESDEKNMKHRFFALARPKGTSKSRAFNKDLIDAHDLARTALGELAQLGTLRRKTELQINQHLQNVCEEKMFSLDDGQVAIWLRYDVPTIAALCAYAISAIIGAGMTDNVRQCYLMECRKFFWRPLTRGPRPTYCCEKHRIRGAKREERRMA